MTPGSSRLRVAYHWIAPVLLISGSLHADPGDIINSVALPSTAQLAITVAPNGIYVVGLSGSTSIYDLSLNLLGSSSAPGGPTGPPTITGIAYRPDSDTLFWLDIGQQLIYETLLDSTIVNTIPLPPSPTGNIIVSNLAYNDLNDSLWINDFGDDQYFEIDLQGNRTASTFDNPLLGPPGTDSFGFGIAHIPGTNTFDVAAGLPSDGQTSTLIRHDLGLGSIAATADLTGVPDTDLSGVAYHPTGSGSGVPVIYAIGSETEVIFEIETFAPLPACSYSQISGFGCDYDPDSESVLVSWTTGGLYDSLRVLRDGVEIDELPGDVTSFVDADLPATPASYHYALVSVLAGEECPGGACRVLAIPGSTLCGQFAVDHAGGQPLGITIAESIDTIYVVDLTTGLAHLYDRALENLGSIVAPPAGPMGFLTGIAWDPTRDHLFWAAPDLALLYETELDGTILAMFPLVSPLGGTIGGISLQTDGDGLIYNDIVFDTYVECDFEGVPTGFTFPNPESTSGPAWGNGIATHPDGTGYELPVGNQMDGQVVHLTTVDPQGAEIGCRREVGTAGDFIDSDFIQGNALTTTGPLGCPGVYRYVVGAFGPANGKIYVEPYGCDGSAPFRRGDADGNGAFNGLVDGLFVLAFQFIPGSPTPPCLDAADADDSGGINGLVDGVFLLSYQFLPGSPAPPLPGPSECGLDPTYDLTDCAIPPSCP